MLKIFRKKAIAKTVFWILVILILPAFVLWGTGSLSGSKEKRPRYVGIINNKKVSFDELYNSMMAVRSLMVLNYFNQEKLLDAALDNKQLIAKLAWDRIIMLKEAGRQKIKIPDKDVVSFIKSHPLFLRNGSFDEKLYAYILRYKFGLAPRSFEEIVRQNLEIRGLNETVTRDITVTDNDIANEYERENQKYKILYILVERKAFLEKAEVYEDSVKSYYETNKGEFLLPAEEGKATPRLASFEDVKASIRSYLADNEARLLALEYATELHRKITELMAKDGLTFEGACSKLNLKTAETPLFSRSDYIEGLGEAKPLADVVSSINPADISAPVETRGGIVIFKTSEIAEIDNNKFEKEKEEFSKKVLEGRKAKALDAWFSEVAKKTKLNIDLNDVERYYR
jgi:hypothetical protein